MDCDGWLSGEQRVLCNANEHDNVIPISYNRVSSMDQEIVEGIKQMAEHKLILLENLGQVREHSPERGRHLLPSLDE